MFAFKVGAVKTCAQRRKLNVDRFSSNLVEIGTESFCKTLLKVYKVCENRRNGSHIVRAWINFNRDFSHFFCPMGVELDKSLSHILLLSTYEIPADRRREGFNFLMDVNQTTYT